MASMTVPRARRGFFIRTDTDGDGLVNGFEGSEVNDPYDVNDEIDDPSLLPDEQLPGGDVDYREGLGIDTDGDGVPDSQEMTDGTDANDPCDFDMDNIVQLQTGAYLAADCDGDGVTKRTGKSRTAPTLRILAGLLTTVVPKNPRATTSSAIAMVTG